MKVQSVAIIDRTELKKEGLKLAARCNALADKLEKFGNPKELDKDRLDEYPGALREKCRLRGAIDFIRELLEEEEVNPEDYGVPCVEVG